MPTQERRHRSAIEPGLTGLARALEKSPRQSRGQVTRRLITRLGEVIGANGALIERHRQSGGKALAPRTRRLIAKPDGELDGLNVTVN
jgi:hypothetical protein